jgi:hypothetical protein
MGATIAVAVVALLALRTAVRWAHLAGTPSVSPSPSVERSVSDIALGAGRSLGVPWRLVGARRDGQLCVDLIQEGVSNGKCSALDGSRPPEFTSAGVGRAIVYFGLLPDGTVRVWADLDDGTVVPGRLFPGDRTGFGLSAYAISVEQHVSGVIVAIGSDGRLAQSFRFVSFDHGALRMPVVDAFGNVMAFVPLERFDPEPVGGRPATAAATRRFAALPLFPVRGEVLDWWRRRPPAGARAAAAASWWESYPLHETLSHPALRA